MNTGEDAQGLRKIIDLTRLISIAILVIHFYILCYKAFQHWGFTAEITDRMVSNIAKTGLFNGWLKPKLAALLFLCISLLGAKGKKNEKIQKNSIVVHILSGLSVYFLSLLVLYLQGSIPLIAGLYIGLTGIGYLLILSGGNWLSRLIKLNLGKDVFNSENETFPQEERLLENEYSINLPTKYKLKGKVRNGWVNCVNPFRSILVSGSAGAGKTYFVIRHIIDQHLKKGFSMLLYDFKFDDLSKMAYNKLLKYHKNYKVKPEFYVIDLEHPKHRCNPLDPESMEDITDATESSRTIMLGLNKEWLKKTGDFFVESPINFLTAIIWYLRKYKNGKYCTLPHVIELMMIDYDPLFALLQQEEEIKALINPFISAYRNNAMAQLEGQIASAKIGLARLSSPQLYYVLSGNDFTLDINNPEAPKVVCMGNNPQKIETYGAVLSLYVSRLLKLVNKKGKMKSSLIFDEFPTLVATGIVSTISTGRSNLISCTLGIQSIEQMKKEYGAEFAEIIAGISGNIISGQVTGESAKKLSETFGKILQDRESLSINSSETSISKSTQLDYAIPASKIATLSSGEFVGIVADSPNEKIRLKMFHAELQNDHEAIAKEEAAYVQIPVIRRVSHDDLQENYYKIKSDIQRLVQDELKDLQKDAPIEIAKRNVKRRDIRKSVPLTKKRGSQKQQKPMSM
ncbi:Type IV secretory system Conjugative DNA transfer [Pedobacter steynii]|uniref:Type IV secretory system Conjugative DNA transfer n=1 Tax=Pedobacter steynii TaxID=430522 RepID=A0A1H0G7W0_9SPHI|nr:conjugal transfer protein MobC [Pedobacter steynii]NQX42346.1 YWFCY domain-containing protein [Pedobacter steynii]SDO02839.1 Type IV secretory system Conjugative DNA transfer [Pedobacter steynii]